MKKIVSGILALTLFAAMSVPTFAATNDEDIQLFRAGYYLDNSYKIIASGMGGVKNSSLEVHNSATNGAPIVEKALAYEQHIAEGTAAGWGLSRLQSYQVQAKTESTYGTYDITVQVVQ